MQPVFSHSSAPLVNNIVKSPLLLSEWSVTTTPLDWLNYPPEVRKRTLEAAKRLPYIDTPRGHETALVKPGRGE